MNDTLQSTPETSTSALRQRITEQAKVLFHEHGYSKVSATEIAQALGISKKTLYKEFETKEDILKAVIFPKLEAGARELDAISTDPNLTYLERLRAVMTLIGMQYQRVSHVLVRDIAMHAPEVWQVIAKFRETRIQKFSELVQQGAREGVFRPEVDPHVVMALYQSAVDSLMNPQTLIELPCTPRDTFRMILTILMEGILRDDVRAEFNKQVQSSAHVESIAAAR